MSTEVVHLSGGMAGDIIFMQKCCLDRCLIYCIKKSDLPNVCMTFYPVKWTNINLFNLLVRFGVFLPNASICQCFLHRDIRVLTYSTTTDKSNLAESTLT